MPNELLAELVSLLVWTSGSGMDHGAVLFSVGRFWIWNADHTTIGADPVRVQGSGPHKNLSVASSLMRT